MQNMDPVDENSNTDITHETEKHRGLTNEVLKAVSKVWSAAILSSELWYLFAHTQNTDSCSWTHIKFVLSGRRVHPAPVGPDTAWFIEVCKWRRLQQVIPTDQSSWPLTLNPQRLKDGLVYKNEETENNLWAGHQQHFIELRS